MRSMMWAICRRNFLGLASLVRTENRRIVEAAIYLQPWPCWRQGLRLSTKKTSAYPSSTPSTATSTTRAAMEVIPISSKNSHRSMNWSLKAATNIKLWRLANAIDAMSIPLIRFTRLKIFTLWEEPMGNHRRGTWWRRLWIMGQLWAVSSRHMILCFTMEVFIILPVLRIGYTMEKPVQNGRKSITPCWCMAGERKITATNTGNFKTLGVANGVKKAISEWEEELMTVPLRVLPKQLSRKSFIKTRTIIRASIWSSLITVLMILKGNRIIF